MNIALGTDTYHATKNEWVVLANAYVDLGTWWCITPFIGAGVGVGAEHMTDEVGADEAGAAGDEDPRGSVLSHEEECGSRSP